MAAISGTLGAAIAGSSLLGGISGSSGTSEGSSTGIDRSWQDAAGESWGSSANSAWNNMDSWSYGNSVNDSWNESQSGGSSASDAYNSSYGRTYGREASAQDVRNAAEANKINADMWQMQAEYNAQEAERSRLWSQKMQDTYYQRLVNDLKSAGLNPILALNGYGSSMQTGATASTGLQSASKANAYAEQRSSSEGYSHSRSDNWSWSKGGSHGESYNRSEAHEQGRSSGSSSQGSKNYSNGGSYGFTNSKNYSQTTNNIRELTGKGTDMIKTAIVAVADAYNKSRYNPNRSTGGHNF